MTTKQDLDTLDRATLVAWRAANVLKWGIAALAVGFAAASAFYLVLAAFPGFTINLSTPKGQALFMLLIAVPTFLSSVAMGVLIGRHVYTRPLAVGAVVATVHLALSIFLAGHDVRISSGIGPYALYTPAGENPFPLALIAILEIYATAVIARSAWEKRPRALRSAL